MLSISEIEKLYPGNERPFKRNILREYLQFKILKIIFTTEYASKLSFMGGTCLRIVFGTSQFSEDLDFDNFGLNASEIEFLSKAVEKQLVADGYTVEIKTLNKGAFRCYVRIPQLLYDNKLSGYQEEKILIQLDTEAQKYDYKSEPFILNKFDILSRIYFTPKDILLSQKIWAILNRRTAKGRDYYDAMFLFGIAKPDYKYLYMKAGISDVNQLKNKLAMKIKSIDFKQLVRDVSPFLVNPKDVKRIELFPDYIKGL